MNIIFNIENTNITTVEINRKYKHSVKINKNLESQLKIVENLNKYNEYSNHEIEICRLDMELTNRLKSTLKKLVKSKNYNYHFVYSYSLDTKEISTVVPNEYPIYFGEGTLNRLLNTDRDFLSTNVYVNLVDRGAIITKRLKTIIRSKKEYGINLAKEEALRIEKYFIKTFNPLFNKKYNYMNKNSVAVKNNSLIVLLKNNQVVKIGTSVRDLEISDIKRSSIHLLLLEKKKEIKGYTVSYIENLNSFNMILVNFLVNSKQFLWERILEYFNVNFEILLKK